MSYEKRPDVPCDSGSIVVELETGDLVSVSCRVMRCTISGNRVFCPSAIQVGLTGEPLVDDDGAVDAGHRFSCPDEIVDTHGEAVIARECLLLVLGEPPTLVDGTPIVAWSPEVAAHSSIRRAISAARAAGVQRDAGSLL